MVLDNICYILNNFLKNSNFDNVIFSWVLHLPETHQEILERLKGHEFEFHNISLLCDKTTIKNRIINRWRTTTANREEEYKEEDLAEIIEMTKERMVHYKDLDTIKIDVSNASKNDVLYKVMDVIGMAPL